MLYTESDSFVALGDTYVYFSHLICFPVFPICNCWIFLCIRKFIISMNHFLNRLFNEAAYDWWAFRIRPSVPVSVIKRNNDFQLQRNS